MRQVRTFDVAICPDCGVLFRRQPGRDDVCCPKHTSPAPKPGMMRTKATARGARIRQGAPVPVVVVREQRPIVERQRTNKEPRVVSGKASATVRIKGKAKGEKKAAKTYTPKEQELTYGTSRRRGPSLEIARAIQRYARWNAMPYEMAAKLWGY